MKTFSSVAMRTILGTSILLLVVWSGLRIAGLPAMLPDERTYVDMALNIAATDVNYPNYLFNALFGLTEVCGLGYYSCGKLINLALVLGTIWLLTASFSTLVGVKRMWLFVGLAVLPVWNHAAIFSPEILYFALALLAMVLAFRAMHESRPILFIVSGAVVGIAALAKPHAFILIPGILLYLLVESKMHQHPKQMGWIKLAFGFLGAALAARMIVGFLLAGPAGLNPLGTTYTKVIERFLGSGSLGAPEALLALGPTPLAQAVVPVGIAVGAIVVNFAVTSLALAAPVALSTRWKVGSETEFSPARSLATLTLSVLAMFSAAIFAWAIIATGVGDDQAQRMLGRYFEFLVPMILLSVLLSLKEFWSEGKALRYRAVAGLLTLFFGMVLLSALIGLQLFDFATLYAVTFNPLLLALILIAVVVLTIALSSAKELDAVGPKITAGLLAVLVAVSGLASYLDLNRLQPLGTDKVGVQARYEVEAIPASELTLITTNRIDSELMRFYLGKPGLQFLILESEEFSVVDVERIRESSKWVLTTGNLVMPAVYSYVRNFDGFQLYYIGEEEIHFFSENMNDSFVIGVDGDYGYASFGLLALGQSLELQLSPTSESSRRFGLQFFVSSDFSGEGLIVEGCGQSTALPVQNRGSANYGEFELAGTCEALNVRSGPFEEGSFGIAFLEVVG